jgi:hypothetical protein
VVPALSAKVGRTSPVCTGRPRNYPIIASIVCAHRTQMIGWSNVASAAICEVFPTLFRSVSTVIP